MNPSQIELPSNRKFGFFFTIIFGILAVYSFYVNSIYWTFILSAISVFIFFATIIKAEILLPLNKLWMNFGLLLGMIVSPIVMGIIFFGIFTPIAILMRVIGRDELALSFKKKTSHWVFREPKVEDDSFKNQF